MSEDDINSLKKSFGKPSALWQRAFYEYNQWAIQNKQRTFNLNCVSCYAKVLQWQINRNKDEISGNL